MMSYSTLLRVLIGVTFLCLFWSCAEDNPETLTINDQQDWKQYLQGRWIHNMSTTTKVRNNVLDSDSLSIEVLFRGDTINVKRKQYGRHAVNVGRSTCVVEYGEPYKFKIVDCVRARKYKVWLKSTFRYDKGDTSGVRRKSMPPGSRESKKLAVQISQALPNLRAKSTDSLRVTYRNANDFYLRRQQPDTDFDLFGWLSDRFQEKG